MICLFKDKALKQLEVKPAKRVQPPVMLAWIMKY